MDVASLFDIAGKTAVVTGGASGLGLAFAEIMAAASARVTILDLDETALPREVERLKSEGRDVYGERLDVTDPEAVEAAFEGAVARTGSLDILFANAGIFAGPGWRGPDPANPRPAEYAIENYSDERWRKVIDVSLNAVFYSIRAAARHMRPRKNGRIIVTTSISALRPSSGSGSAYAAAKAGAAHMVKAFALELARDNVLVNAIAPGAFITNIADSLQDEEVRARRAQAIPVGRIAYPEEIKGLALYLASPASSYVTGQQFVIDGGVSIGG